MTLTIWIPGSQQANLNNAASFLYQRLEFEPVVYVLYAEKDALANMVEMIVE